jgi:short-subunit dehydrogenase
MRQKRHSFFTSANRQNSKLKVQGVQVMVACQGPTETSFSTKMRNGAVDSAELAVRRTLQSADQKRSVAYPERFGGRVAIWLPRLLPGNVVVSAAASAGLAGWAWLHRRRGKTSTGAS